MRSDNRTNNFHHCRRLLLKDDGAVTLFAVIVLSSLLLFFSLLIDYARIAAFHKLTEDALRSSVRSVLSAYDSTLYERYGLFGRGGTEGQSIFAEAMQANLEGIPMASQNGMKLVRTKVEAAALHSASFLGDHDVFARQVLEEMKYKAPVDFTLELASKFMPLAGAMKESAITLHLLESMRRQYEKREAHFARALQLQQQAAAVIDGSGVAALIPVQTTALAAGEDTALLIASEYSTYATLVMKDQALTIGEESIYTNEIDAYEEKARAVVIELRQLSANMKKQHDRLHGDALRELEEAQLINEDMQRLAQQVDQTTISEGYESVARSRVAGADPHQVPGSELSKLEQVKQSADELLLPDSWFASYRLELEAQGAAAAAIDMEAGSFQSNSSASMARPITGMNADSLLEGVTSLRLAYGAYEEKYIRPAAVLMNRKQMLEGGPIKAQLKQQEEKAGSLWSQAREMLHSLTTLPQMEEHVELFKQVELSYNDNLLFNQQSVEEEAGRGQHEQAKDAYEAADQSSAMMSGLYSGLAGMLERTRDALYYGEYVIHHYSFFAPQQLRAMLTEGEVTELSHALAFNNQEAEYIIYGFHNPVGNIAAAYGELFATRLAIRTMEGLIESRSLGHPLLILSAALIYGLEKTIEDLLAFTERGSAPLSKYVRAELSYTDYLRLFMLMHSADEGARLARMIAVIEQNSGAALSAVPSGVTGEAQISLQLWFLPGLMRVLGRFGLLEGKVVGNRYETTQTIGWSY
ncbi:hypothetical protein [Paenibacillus sp. sgz302251]|uniref:hypothetical protein n=1 Tax=Paenibacillus sp. sgz302251 TaxID=3414493 RepID=UPI003C7E07B8